MPKRAATGYESSVCEAYMEPRSIDVVQSEHIHTRKYTENQRNEQRENPEEQPAPKIEPQVIHIYLQAGKEHKVKQPHLTEDCKRRVVVEHIESVRANDHTGRNHAYDMRYLEFIEQ